MSEKPFQPLERFTEGSRGAFANIEQAKKNPDLLIKEIVWLAEDLKPDYTFEEFEQEVVLPFRALQEQGFGKFIPEALPVWGKDDVGRERGYMVMKKVRGADIQYVEKLDFRLAKELDDLVAKSLDAVTNALRSGQEIISPDIAESNVSSGNDLRNLMVGTVGGDEEKHVWLVDVYPAKTRRDQDYYEDVDPEKLRREWMERIERYSAKSTGGYLFPLSRDALERLIAALQEERQPVGR